jgi:hypothetical protein
VIQGDMKFVYGWDQPCQSFYLQVLDTSRDEEDQVITWDGYTPDTRMYEVEHLVQRAHKEGLEIPLDQQSELYLEKDDGR